MSRYQIKALCSIISTKVQCDASGQWGQMASRVRFNELRGRDGEISAGNMANRCAVGIKSQSKERPSPPQRAGQLARDAERLGETSTC
eukprot:252655-Pyramimonas_sp.AAC.1